MKYQVDSILSHGVVFGKIHIMDKMENEDSDSSNDYVKLDIGQI